MHRTERAKTATVDSERDGVQQHRQQTIESALSPGWLAPPHAPRWTSDPPQLDVPRAPRAPLAHLAHLAHPPPWRGRR